MICQVEGCSNPVAARSGSSAGLCSGHGNRLRRYGTPTGTPTPKTRGVCAVEGCDGKLAGSGYCRKHYARFRAHGDPTAGSLSKGEARRFLLEVMGREPTTECISWPYGKTSSGVGRINWNGSPTNVQAVVAELKHGVKPTPAHEACHSCGKGHEGCMNPEHIYWGTRKENVADAIAHGTAFLFQTVTKHGERSPVAKLTDEQVGEIRERIAAGEKQVDLAREFGMSKTHVNRIWKGTSRNLRAANDNEAGRMVA